MHCRCLWFVTVGNELLMVLALASGQCVGHAYFRKWLPGRDGAICVCVMAHDPSITILPGSQEWLPLQFVWMFVRKPLEQSENPLFFVLYDGVMYEWINPLLSIVPNSLDTFFWQV